MHCRPVVHYRVVWSIDDFFYRIRSLQRCTMGGINAYKLVGLEYCLRSMTCLLLGSVNLVASPAVNLLVKQCWLGHEITGIDVPFGL